MKGNLLDMSNVDNGTLKGSFVIGTVSSPDGTAFGSDVTVTGISEHNGQITISTNYGDLVLAKTSDTTAAYTFTLKNTENEGATNKLAEGQTVTLNFEPYVRDEYDATDGNADTLRNGTPHSTAITITIEGTNDAPVVTQNAWGSAASDVTVTADGRGVTLTEQVDQNAATSAVSGTFTAHDVDNGDSLTYGMVENGGNVMHPSIYVVMGSDGKLATTTDPSAPKGADYVGVFTLTSGAAGTTGYIFTMDNASPAVQGMQNGNSYDVSILLTARDSFGAYVQQSVTVTVKGANDTPVVTVAAKDGLAGLDAAIGLEGQFIFRVVEHEVADLEGEQVGVGDDSPGARALFDGFEHGNGIRSLAVVEKRPRAECAGLAPEGTGGIELEEVLEGGGGDRATRRTRPTQQSRPRPCGRRRWRRSGRWSPSWLPAHEGERVDRPARPSVAARLGPWRAD